MRLEPSASASEYQEEPEQIQVQDLRSMLAELLVHREELAVREATLAQEYKASLEKLRTQEAKDIQTLMSKEFPNVIFTAGQADKVVNFHIEREANKSTTLSTLVDKAIKPVLNPELLPQKKGDVDTEELAEARAFHSQTLQAAKPRLGENYGIGTRIQLLGLLKEELLKDTKFDILLLIAKKIATVPRKAMKNLDQICIRIMKTQQRKSLH